MGSPTINVEWRDLIGKPFAYRGRGPEYYDCYGLLIEMKHRAGIQIPDYPSPTQMPQIADRMGAFIGEWELCERQAGVAVGFYMTFRENGKLVRRVAHAGYMLSENRMIHTWEASGGVTVEELTEWERRISGFYRYKNNNNVLCS